MSQTGIGEGADPEILTTSPRCAVTMSSSRSQATTAPCPGSDGRRDAARLPTSFVACGV
jgi:hypothetical protein